MNESLTKLIMIPIAALVITGVLWCVLKIMGEKIKLKFIFLTSFIVAVIPEFFKKIPLIDEVIAIAIQAYLLSKWAQIRRGKSFLAVIITHAILIIFLVIIMTFGMFLPIFLINGIGN